jgi:putative two-component system response regulator
VQTALAFDAPASRGCLLVVDDEPSVRGVMARILSRSGYRVLEAESGEQAIETVEREAVDLVLSDIHMPGRVSGLELIDALHLGSPSLPIVLVTGSGDETNLRKALDLGAAGFISKPFTSAELREKVSRSLERVLLTEVELRERLLAPTVASVLANAIEVRDGSMQGHTERLASLAVEIGRLNGLSQTELEALELGAVLHDIGKIGIPDSILLKPGALNADERAAICTHVEIGDRLLAPLDLLEQVRPVVRHHHERWDGTGYPDRLAGSDIPFLARIVAIADSVEAMSGQRPYRTPLSANDVIRELGQGRERQWDPLLVDCVLELIKVGRLAFGPGGLSLPDR